MRFHTILWKDSFMKQQILYHFSSKKLPRIKIYDGDDLIVEGKVKYVDTKSKRNEMNRKMTAFSKWF